MDPLVCGSQLFSSSFPVTRGKVQEMIWIGSDGLVTCLHMFLK